ncbi:hypothetical protein A0H81_01277 [Grifola frondosa]|uniref:Uncharacterized protein n=1 Tax=Grifola frondosa TaxID=5627 RepID=A0A1C7MP47_GRIFR|nr:hypothetical protein A0H81_01277 [Grifola frondosa]
MCRLSDLPSRQSNHPPRHILCNTAVTSATLEFSVRESKLIENRSRQNIGHVAYLPSVAVPLWFPASYITTSRE